MSITITENAADRVKTFLENRGSGVGLKSGCENNWMLWYGLYNRVCRQYR